MLTNVLQKIDIMNVKMKSGQTLGQEVASAADTLRSCIQARIRHTSLGAAVSAGDLAIIKADGLHISVTLKLNNVIRPSIFKKWNGKDANIFWLLNDGFNVKKTEYFWWAKKPNNWIHREAERFVDDGIADFQARDKLGFKIEVHRPLFYYGVE